MTVSMNLLARALKEKSLEAHHTHDFPSFKEEENGEPLIKSQKDSLERNNNLISNNQFT